MDKKELIDFIDDDHQAFMRIRTIVHEYLKGNPDNIFTDDYAELTKRDKDLMIALSSIWQDRFRAHDKITSVVS